MEWPCRYSWLAGECHQNLQCFKHRHDNNNSGKKRDNYLLCPRQMPYSIKIDSITYLVGANNTSTQQDCNFSLHTHTHGDLSRLHYPGKLHACIIPMEYTVVVKLQTIEWHIRSQLDVGVQIAWRVSQLNLLGIPPVEQQWVTYWNPWPIEILWGWIHQSSSKS